MLQAVHEGDAGPHEREQVRTVEPPPSRLVALAIDAAGDVVAVGGKVNTTSDLAVVKLAGVDGTVLWSRDIDGTGNGNDTGTAVAVTGSGDVVAGGTAMVDVVRGSPSQALFVVELSGVDGGNLWTTYSRRVHAPKTLTTTDDIVGALAVDPAGNVDVVGTSTGDSTFWDFAVVQLSGSTGNISWRRDYDTGTRYVVGETDGGTSIALDAAET